MNFRWNVCSRKRLFDEMSVRWNDQSIFFQGITVEIKCPYIDQDALKKKNVNVPKTIREAVQNKIGALPSHIVFSHGQMMLKPSSSWYAQIQCQLECADVEEAYLFVYLEIDNTTIQDGELLKIARDRNWWDEKLLPKLIDFYHGSFLPEVVARNGADNVAEYRRAWELSEEERALYSENFLANYNIQAYQWPLEDNE